MAAPESAIFNNNSLVLNTLLSTNATGVTVNYPTTEDCSMNQQVEIERAFNLGRGAAMVAMYDVDRGTGSPYGFK